MYLLRTAIAIGALTVSLPGLAQDSRYGWDRGRAERRDRGRDDGRSTDRSADRGGQRNEGRTDAKNESRGAPRVEPNNAGRGGDRGAGRVEPRGGGGERGWERREARPVPDGRWDRRDEGRIVVRPPVVIDRRDNRYERRVIPPGHVYRYRYGDWDFRNREIITIGAWFRALPPARLTAYGYYGPSYTGLRYAFRPGLYLSVAVYDQLQWLPYELEEDLGELPWYLERRIYGNTVLVIDSRTRLIVDIFDLDYR